MSCVDYIYSSLCLVIHYMSFPFWFEGMRNKLRVLTRNFGKMTFLRHLGKSVRLKSSQHAVRHVKCSWESGGFYLGFFVLKRSL